MSPQTSSFENQSLRRSAIRHWALKGPVDGDWPPARPGQSSGAAQAVSQRGPFVHIYIMLSGWSAWVCWWGVKRVRTPERSKGTCAASELAVIPQGGIDDQFSQLPQGGRHVSGGVGRDWDILGFNFCSSDGTAVLLVVRGFQRETELKLDKLYLFHMNPKTGTLPAQLLFSYQCFTVRLTSRDTPGNIHVYSIMRWPHGSTVFCMRSGRRIQVVEGNNTLGLKL